MISSPEIIENILNPNDEDLFRPSLEELPRSIETKEESVPRRLQSLIRDLWSEDHRLRPNCAHALATLIKINPFK